MRIKSRPSHLLSLFGHTGRVVFLSFMTVFAILPIFWTVMTSFKNRSDVFGMVFKFTPQLDSYEKIFSREGAQILQGLANSIKVASLNVIIVVLVGTMAAYALSRLHFKGRNTVLLGVLASRLMPPVVVILPLFLFASKAGRLDSVFTLACLHAVFNLPMCIWLLKSFFDTIPVELEEAVLIDGGSRITCAFRILLPLARAGIATTALFAFVFSWNEFLFALVFTQKYSKTAPIMLANATYGEAQIFWSDMAALATIIMIPAIILAVFGQRFFVKGLTHGSSK